MQNHMMKILKQNSEIKTTQDKFDELRKESIDRYFNFQLIAKDTQIQSLIAEKLHGQTTTDDGKMN